MKISASILTLLLFQFSAAFPDDLYDSLENYSGPDSPELYSAFSRPTRSDAFLRFGKSHVSHEETNEIPSYTENFIRPTRSEAMPKNNELFVRFGRNKNDIFSRMGIPPPTRFQPMDQQMIPRQFASDFLRFGRSIKDNEDKEISSRNAQKLHRSKREIVIPESLKRKDNFLRFGRNSNFMRFGRSGTHNRFPYYFPKSGEDSLTIAKLLKKLQYENLLKNHNDIAE